MKKTEDRASELFDYLANQSKGATTAEIKTQLGYTRGSEVRRVVRALRLILGEFDSINLVCDTPSNSETGAWTYRLVGTIESTQGWQSWRLGSLETQIKTCRAVAASVVAGSDGRTRDGKRARLMERHLGRLLEDLADIEMATNHS